MKKKTDNEPVEPPENAPQPEPDAEIPRADQELVELRAERERLDAQLRRAVADLQNFRKRQMREFEELRKRTLEGLIAELLPVLDNFHLALQAHDAQNDEEGNSHTMIEGLRMVQTLLQAALERHGMSEIPAADQAFDPTRHEAVGVVPRDDLEEGRVADVVQRGYQIGDKIIRPARVMVAGRPAEESGDSPDEDHPERAGDQ
jgi:molecular chaperone GrpE